jgi:hypothetical protein
MALGFNPPQYTIAYAQSSTVNFTVPAGKTKMAVVYIASGATGVTGSAGSSGGQGGNGGRGGGGLCFADFAVVAGENFTVPTAGSFIRNNDSFVLANANAASGTQSGNATIFATANQKTSAGGSTRGTGGSSGLAGNSGATGATLSMTLDGIGVVEFISGSGGGGGGAGANITNIGGAGGGAAGTSGTGAGNAGVGGSAVKNSNTVALANAGQSGGSPTVTNPLSNAAVNAGRGGGGGGGAGGGGRVNSPSRSGVGGSATFNSSTVIRIYFA